MSEPPPAALHPAYFETRFFIAGPRRRLPDDGVILSAYATTGSAWLPEENHRADARLADHLRSLGVSLDHRLIGYSPTTGHAEPGWLVALTPGRGREVGRMFHQDAIYALDDGLLVVMRCAPPAAAEPVAPLAERLDWLPAEDFALRLAAC